MTKDNWIDLFIDWAAGGDAPQEIKGQYHPRIAEKYIELGFDDIIKATFEEAQKRGDYSELDNFIQVYESVAVNYNSTRAKYYSTFPAAVMSLPGNAGIRLISAVQDESYAFNPIPMDSVAVFEALETSSQPGPPSYMTEGDKAIYKWMNTDITEVLMKLIVPFSGLSSNDIIRVPGGKNILLFDTIRNIMMGKPKEDLSNDNNTIRPR